MLLSVLSAVAMVPDGARLRPATQCFAIMQNEKVVGATYQRIAPIRFHGRRAWDIIVHQRVGGGSFDLRDHFLLDGRDLRPLHFDSQKSGADHVSLDYANGRIRGWRTERGQRQAVDLPNLQRVWEGNLWGVTFGALPLTQSAQFTLPFYQYDRGFGRFSGRVTGGEEVILETARVPVWTVEVRADDKQRVTYLIGKADGAEIGTRAGPFETRLGGDCNGLS